MPLVNIGSKKGMEINLSSNVLTMHFLFFSIFYTDQLNSHQYAGFLRDKTMKYKYIHIPNDDLQNFLLMWIKIIGRQVYTLLVFRSTNAEPVYKTLSTSIIYSSMFFPFLNPATLYQIISNYPFEGFPEKKYLTFIFP